MATATCITKKEADAQKRKTPRIDHSLQPLSNTPRQNRRCRRHSFAFRCAKNEIDDTEDEGKHYESILLVKVIASYFASY